MKKRNEEFYNDPWERESYETGSTRPPENRHGITSLLLVLVIVLGSICSALGIVNLRLLQQLDAYEGDSNTINLFESQPEDSLIASVDPYENSVPFPRLGLEGQSVSDFDRQFYDLPQGLLVTGVSEDSCAHAAGIHAGDVITSLGGHPIRNQEDLAAVLENCPASKALTVEFFRHQTEKNMKTTITIPEE